MKKIILSLLALAATAPAGAQMQLRINEKASLENVKVRQSRDTVFVDFDVVADGRALKRKEAVMMAPQIRGGVNINLPAIVVSGTRHAQIYKREQALEGRDSDNKPGLVMKVSPKGTATGHYRAAFLAGPQAAGATFKIESWVETCCKESQRQLRDLLAEPIKGWIEAAQVSHADVDINGMVAWLEPAEEQVKRRETSVTANITYPQGVFEVRPAFEENALELSRIEQILSPMLDDDTYDIRNVRIDGYASIEGQWDTNEQLARKRAEEFSNWLQRRYRTGNLTVTSHGEDWEGLTEMIRADNSMPYKYETLAIIDNYGIFGGREKQLMDLGQGVPYRYMYRYFFPKLRRMVITFGYDVKAFDEKEAADVLAKRPEDLSHAEMMRTLKAQKINSREIYRRIAQQFPEDPVALINASSAEMVMGNAEGAWKYLEKVQGDPRAAGNMKAYKALVEAGQKSGGPYLYKIAE